MTSIAEKQRTALLRCVGFLGGIGVLIAGLSHDLESVLRAIPVGIGLLVLVVGLGLADLIDTGRQTTRQGQPPDHADEGRPPDRRD